MAVNIFELKVGAEVIPMQWGSLAMKLFTDYKRITIIQFFELLENYSRGQYTVSDIFLFIKCAAEAGSGCTKVFKDTEIAEWFDEIGGMSGIVKNSGQISEFFAYVIGNTIVDVTPTDMPGEAETTDEEKKT